MQSIELPNLPNGWTVTELQNCVDILDGQRVPVNSREREKRRGNIPYYGATGQIGWIDDFLFDQELLLLGEDGAPFFDPTKNKAYIIKGKSWVNNHAHVLRAKDSITTNSYLCYYLNNFRYDGYVSGTTRPKLNQAPMRRIPIKLAPLNEQKRIVCKIEELFTKLDAGIEYLKKARIELKRYKQSVLKAAFEGELTKQSAGDEPASDLLENICVKNDKKPNSISRSGRIEESLRSLPRGWAWTTIGNITENLDGKRIPVSDEKRKLMKGSYPYYGASGIIDYVNSFIFDGSFLLIGEDGANLLSRSTPIAFIATGKFWVNNHAHVLSTLGNIPLAYIESYFNSIDLSEWVTGTAQPKLTQAKMNSIPIPLAPLKEQDRIVEKIALALSACNNTGQIIDQNLLHAQKLRWTILNEAFQGKLVPQDRNDEPAETLLTRIGELRKPAIMANSAHFSS